MASQRLAAAVAATVALWVLHALFAAWMAAQSVLAGLLRLLTPPRGCLVCALALRAAAAVTRLAPLPAPLRRRLMQRLAPRCAAGAPPGCVAFAFGGGGEAAAAPRAVAALALSAVAEGARHVILYDDAGELQHALEPLAAALAAAGPTTALLLGGGRGPRRRCYALGAACHASPPAQPPVTLWVLAPEDAYAPLLHLARTDALACADALAPPVACGGSASALVRAAEAALAGSTAHAPPPPPACIFLVGPAPSLAGFPPWLAAGAELYHLGPLRAAARGGGVAAGTARFARTQQRLGQ